MTLHQKGILFLGISVLLYSVMPVLIRLLGASYVPPATQVFLRYIVAFMCAVVYFVLTKAALTIRNRDITILLTVALFGYAFTNLFYTYAILLTHVGTVLFIFFCSSIITPILGYVFLKERLNWAKVVALVCGFLALFFLFRPGPVATWKAGALLALLSALGQCVYVIGRKKIGGVNSASVLLVNTFVGVVAVGVISLAREAYFFTDSQGIGALSLQTWLVTVLFGIDNFAAWLFMTKGFQLVSAGTGSLVMLSENIIGVMFAFIFFSEIPTIATMIGGGLVFFASLLVIFKGDKG